jgi:hypothetical protein
MTATEKRIKELDRLIRRLRSDRRLDGEDEQAYARVHNLLGKALEHRAKLRQSESCNVGPYSGLTRQELRQSGTCETDWY